MYSVIWLPLTLKNTLSSLSNSSSISVNVFSVSVPTLPAVTVPSAFTVIWSTLGFLAPPVT